jgi:hypothetical protein
LSLCAGPLYSPAMFTDETVLWTIAAAGRVEGCVVRERGRWRLSWFDGADRRLASYAGPVDDDLEGLAVVLGRRLGRPVELQSLPS